MRHSGYSKAPEKAHDLVFEVKYLKPLRLRISHSAIKYIFTKFQKHKHLRGMVKRESHV